MHQVQPRTNLIMILFRGGTKPSNTALARWADQTYLFASDKKSVGLYVSRVSKYTCFRAFAREFIPYVRTLNVLTYFRLTFYFLHFKHFNCKFAWCHLQKGTSDLLGGQIGVVRGLISAPKLPLNGFWIAHSHFVFLRQFAGKQ